jgi:hypothetical protein
LPSRATPYLAPAAGAIISATTLARAREGSEVTHCQCCRFFDLLSMTP